MAKLTAAACTKLGDGKHGDGDGLSLIVRGAHRSWLFRYSVGGVQRETGLGKLSHVGLADARRLAADLRAKIHQGIDPLAEKRATQKAVNVARVTSGKKQSLLSVVRTYHEKFCEPVLTTKHARQWIRSIELNVPTDILEANVDSIRAGDLLDALQPLFARIPETAHRVRQRLDTVFDYAILHEMAEVNPAAAIRRSLRQQRRGKKNFRALPYVEVPEFFKALSGIECITASALAFLLLTASRTQEVLNARWSEINGEVWTVVEETMKMRIEHVVFLSQPAMKILGSMKGLSDELVFPIENVPMSNMAMLELLKRTGWHKKTTVHGLRTSFSTWANETNAARNDVIEACLAHKEKDKTRAAYNKAKFIQARKELLIAWANYCTAKEATSH